MSNVVKATGVAELRRFRPYPTYKDSGVDWLRQIPEHWNSRPLKYFIRAPLAYGVLKPDKYTGADGVRLIRILDIEAGEVHEASLEVISPGQSREFSRTIVRVGDVIVSVVGTIGRAFVVPQSLEGANLSRALARVQLKPTLLPRFLEYYFESHSFMSFVDLISAGTAQRVLNLSDLGNFSLAAASESEQQKIVDFLDRETAKIDASVAKKERLIELLQEKRAALITRAVTKGLDPNVAMKDSGVEWFGRVPTHWKITPLKRRTVRIQTGSTPPTGEAQYYTEGTIPWYGPASFSVDLPLQAPAKFISESALRDGVARMFGAGSTLIVTIGATIGKVGYLENPGSSNQQITGVSFDVVEVFPRYGAYQLKTLEPVLRGIAPNSTLPILDQEKVGYLPLLTPPKLEQERIVVFLDRETAKIDELIAKIRGVIGRLSEMRTVVISAAVTGKIDVREEAP